MNSTLHSTLIFDLTSISQRRQQSEQHELYYHQLLAEAEWMFSQPIPMQPATMPSFMLKPVPPPPGVSPFHPQYLLSLDDYERTSAAYARALPELAFAYHATGNRKYADRAIEWIEMFVVRWEDWGSLDSLAIKIMYATAIGCSWLHEVMPPTLMNQAKRKTSEYFERCLSEWLDDIMNIKNKQLSPSNRYIGNQWWYGHFIGNHWWYNTGKLGVTALWLGRMDIATAISAHYRPLLQMSLGADGDYLDKPHYLLWALRWTIPFLLAVERAEQTTILDDPLLGQAALWLTATRSPADLNWIDWPRGFTSPWIYLLLASRHRLPAVQWMGLQLRERMMVRHEHAYIHFYAGNSYLNFMLYDETLQEQHPRTEPRLAGRRYQATGWVFLRDQWDEQAVSVTVYAGPASDKNYHDQGQICLEAYGQKILGYPLLPFDNYLSAHVAAPYQMSNQTGYVALVQGEGQASGSYPREWKPMADALQMTCEPPLGQILQFHSEPQFHRVKVDISRAYQDFSQVGLWGHQVTAPAHWAHLSAHRLAKFERTVSLYHNEWLVIQDELLTSDEQSHPISLRHTTVDMAPSIVESNVVVFDGGLAKAKMWVWSNQPVHLTIQPYHHAELGKMVMLNTQVPVQQLSVIWVIQVCRVDADFAQSPAPADRFPTHLQLGSQLVSIENRP